MVPARPRRRNNIHPEVTEKDFEILVPVFEAVKYAFLRKPYIIGQPIDSMAEFITLVAVAAISKQLREIGFYDEHEPDDNDLW
jgi:hypothetical protein